MWESKKPSQSSIPGFEVVVGEPRTMMDGGISFDGECTFQASADYLRLLEDCQPDGNDLNELLDRFKKSKEYGMSGLSSTASTVASSMATQWISQMKKSFKRRAMNLTEEQQEAMRKIVTDKLYQHTSIEIAAKDIMLLYCHGLEAHHVGRYRECFERLRPCMPFLNTNVLVWVRISEALIYEFYEEVWEFNDIYARLFERCPRSYRPSKSRQNNEVRRRHPLMDLRYAETATMMTFALARHSSKGCVHFSASTLHGFLCLKMKKWTEAIEAINFTLNKYGDEDNTHGEMNILMTYKAEALLGQGRYNRSIEYCLRVIKTTTNSRTKQRALMLMAMAYIRKSNFMKAYENVILILSEPRLDEHMLENVALLGLNLAHLMGNAPLFKKFEDLLQSIVY